MQQEPLLSLVEDKSQANIATEMNDSTITATGEAESQTNVLTKRFTKVTVRLNAYYLLNSYYGYSHERIVNTAFHELVMPLDWIIMSLSLSCSQQDLSIVSSQ